MTKWHKKLQFGLQVAGAAAQHETVSPCRVRRPPLAKPGRHTSRLDTTGPGKARGSRIHPVRRRVNGKTQPVRK
jgi:hypothetical protein